MKNRPRFLNLVLVFVFVFSALGLMPQTVVAQPNIMINEVDADTPSYDKEEFIELFDEGIGGTSLDGLVLVFFNGSNDLSYAAYDLDGYSTNTNGYFVLCGNSSNVDNCDYDVGKTQDLIQNGADAVALYVDDASSFPSNTPVTTTNLLDALVYDTSDDDDSGLLILLNEGQPQVNEDGLGDKDYHSNQRCPNGSGGLRNTGTFTQFTPTPGTQNCIIPLSDPVINEFSASTTGSDVEYVEIFGDPMADYSAYKVLEIEGDSGSTIGSIDEVIDIGTTDVNGLFLVNLPANALENGTISLLLVKNFNGVLNNDIDATNDGLIDYVFWSEIVDSVAIHDGGTGDITYGTTVLTESYDGLPDVPGGASRIPDGYDTDSITDWVRNDFDLGVIPGYEGSLVLGEAYNTPGEPNRVYETCESPFTPIYAIQGNDIESPIKNTTVTTQGVVVGNFQYGLSGFFIQDPDGDSNPETSDGIFVYESSTPVSVGDYVRVQGTAVEYNGLTEISDVTGVLVCPVSEPMPAPTPVTLPVPNEDYLERYEGMLVTFPQDLVISEYFEFDHYGEIMLTSERFTNPTSLYTPNTPEVDAALQAYTLGSITLDDGRTWQNPDPAIHPNSLEFNLFNRFRGGDLATNVTGIIDYSFGKYRVQPTQGANYTAVNTRPAQLDIIPGDIKVASFNVLNYFTTLNNAGDICGPLENMDCRGADTAEEFTRQRDKIIAAIATIDADVVGLIEIENDRLSLPPDYPVADLVQGLNDLMGAGTYNYIPTGAIGSDAIKVALIYKPANVTPMGAFAILDETVDPNFLDDYNRPVLAQTFTSNTVGESVTVAVNHLKSKGSSCAAIGDPDEGDGAGNCNITRTWAATAEVQWLASDPTGTGVENILIIGDLNSYDKEDPITAIKAGPDDLGGTADDYTDLILEHLGEHAYSYVFDGRWGYLDYAMTNAALHPFVTDVDIWHINADEPDILDYDMSYKKDAQDAIYAPDPFRASDHDPVIVTLTFNQPPVAMDDYYETNQDVTLVVPAAGVLDNDDDLNVHDQIVLDVSLPPQHGQLTLSQDGSFTYVPDVRFYGEDTFVYDLLAIPPGMTRGEYVDSATVTIKVHPKYKYYYPTFNR